MSREPGPLAVTDRLSRRALLSPRGLCAALGLGIGGAGTAPPRPLVALVGPPAARHTPRILPVLRPPGAIDEAEFMQLCTRCDACVEACPHDAVVRAPFRLRAAAGTPMVDPLEAPCRVCVDVPCVRACPTGALREDASRVLGRAVIGAQDCLAHRGSSCSVCVERCPVPGALRLERGRPVIDASRCTGCGVCQHVCPAPRNAVIILPALRRGAETR